MSNLQVQGDKTLNGHQNANLINNFARPIALSIGSASVLYYSPVIVDTLKPLFSYAVTTISDSLIARYIIASPLLTCLTCTIIANRLPESSFKRPILLGGTILYSCYSLISTLVNETCENNFLTLAAFVAAFSLPEGGLKTSIIGSSVILYSCYWFMSPFISESIKSSIEPYIISRLIFPLLCLSVGAIVYHGSLSEEHFKNAVANITVKGLFLFFGYLSCLLGSAIRSLAPDTSILAYGIPLLMTVVLCIPRYFLTDLTGIKSNVAMSCLTALCCASCFTLFYKFDSLEALFTNYLSVAVSHSLIWIGYGSCLSALVLIEVAYLFFALKVYPGILVLEHLARDINAYLGKLRRN